MSKSLDGDSEGSCKSEVADFYVSTLSYKKVLWFKISMYYPPRMTVINSLQNLVEHLFNLKLGDISLVLPHILLKIVIDILKDEVKFLKFRLEDYFLQVNYVGVFELLQDGYFSHCSRWHTLTITLNENCVYLHPRFRA